MDRRSFLGSILTACVAPAIVRADSLMRVVPTGMTILKPMQPGLSTMFDGHPLFEGVLGEYQGVRIMTSPEIRRIFGAALFAATRTKPRFHAIILHPSDYADLKGPQ